MTVNATAFDVLLQPGGQSGPLFDQRLVDELDGAVVGDEQPTLDQRG